MKTKLISMTAIAAIFFVVGCKKTANHSTGVSYQLKTINHSSTITRAYSTGNLITSSVGVQGGTIDWTSGYASAKEIKFEAEGSGVHVKFQSETPQKIDLFSPLSSLGNVVIPTGVYESAQFEIELLHTVTDAALELKGTYNNTPVIFRIAGDFEIDAELPAITIKDGTNYTALTALNLANLTTGISGATLDAATRDGSGTIVISATTNASLYDAMLNNLQNSDAEDFR